MPTEYERKFILCGPARQQALVTYHQQRAAAPSSGDGAAITAILDAYLPPLSGDGPMLRIRAQGPLDGPEPTHGIACVKLPLADGGGGYGRKVAEHEWRVPLPLRLADAALIAKRRVPLPGAPEGTVLTLDFYLAPAAQVCPVTGEPQEGPVVVGEIEGDPAAVDAWAPPPGWVEVTGRSEMSACKVALNGWPRPAG